MLTKNLKNITKKDVAMAGGKGASLGEMAKAGIPVPPGFVILTSAFAEFLSQSGLEWKIDETIKRVDYNRTSSVNAASSRIGQYITKANIPETISQEIMAEFKKLKSKYVAVRSSATAEDSSSASWAGELESYLNTTEKNLISNVKKCWSSLYTPRAIFYRKKQGLLDKKVSVAVVVQKMVESETAGIAFTIHPVTNDQNQIVIEAGFGLGEAIVSGSVTPDSYVINKRGYKIAEINVNDKKKALYRKAGGGNIWKGLGAKSIKPVLAKSEIIRLSKLISRIERHYRQPCDIEWAQENGRFYITQSRPVTTLKTESTRKEKKEKINEWEFLWAEENESLFDAEHVLANHGRNAENRFGYGARDVALIYRNFSVEFYLSREELDRIGQMGYEFYNKPKNFRYLVSEIKKDRDAVMKMMQKVIDADLSRLTPDELSGLGSGYGRCVSRIFTCYTMTQPYRVKKLEDELVQYFKTLSIGNKQEIISILTEPKTRFIFTAKNNTLLESFARTVKKENYRIDKDILSGKFSREEKVDQRERNELIRKLKLPKRIIYITEVLRTLAEERLRMRFVWMKSMYVSELFLAETKRESGVPKREQRLYDPDEYTDLLKKGKKVAVNKLAGRTDGVAVIMKQGRIRILNTADSKKFISKMSNHGEIKDQLEGFAVSSGSAIGRVVILSFRKDTEKHAKKIDRMKPGDIVVSEMTRPSIISACQKAGAIITDEGGILSHAAIVARELNLPCIIGTKHATQVLRDGDTVEVDTAKGLVKILKSKK